MKKEARDEVIEHATQIKKAIHDPSSFLTELHIQQQQYYSLQWLTHFGVLDQIPLPPNTVSYHAVAKSLKIPESVLRSNARMAMTSGFLCESPNCNLSHNTLSASFVEDKHMKVQLSHMFNATIPVMAGLLKATEKWGDTQASNETAYNIANNTNLPFFQHLKAQPDLQKKFEEYMKSRAVSHTGSNAAYLLEAFDWNALGAAKVVDVGGSSGSTAIMLATAYPHLNVVVEDLPGPIANAQSIISKLSENIRPRVQAIEHDFFQPQPHVGADVYLLRTILHDWPDADAIKILKCTVSAMASSSRLLIMDMVLPKPGSGSSTHEAALRQKDLMMIGTFNAKEREEEEWIDLLKKTDPRLIVKAISRPAGSELSVIEVVLGHGEANKNIVNGSN